MGNIIRTFEAQDQDLDEDDPWLGILSATMFALRATYHTTLQATPMQLAFGRDAILNTTFEANWKFIQERKQRIIRKNNQRENRKRIPHRYKRNDLVLLNDETTKAKYGRNPWKGPFRIIKVNNNGTVRLKMGKVTNTLNI